MNSSEVEALAASTLGQLGLGKWSQWSREHDNLSPTELTLLGQYAAAEYWTMSCSCSNNSGLIPFVSVYGGSSLRGWSLRLPNGPHNAVETKATNKSTVINTLGIIL